MSESIVEIEGTWEEVRTHDAELIGRRVRLFVYPPEASQAHDRTLLSRAPSARELMQMSVEERSHILAAQAEKAESIYRNDPELTGFDAFGEEDLYDETPAR